jgi:hypothetical protein
MKVYVFGNKDSPVDNAAFQVEAKLKQEFPQVAFVEVDENADLPFENEESVTLIDTVDGLEQTEIITDEDLDKLVVKQSSSVHDYDLGFQLKYLKKLGKIGSVTILGIPMGKEIDYLRIQLIFKKLVAQDIQGS